MCCVSVPFVRLSGLAVCLSVLCVSAFTSHDDTFRYELLTARRAVSCTMCIRDECWELQIDRCHYYAEVDEVRSITESGGTASEVDVLVHDMLGLADVPWISQVCIPLISQYTDCNKENICLGCKSCTCDALGRWRCKQVQRCRADPELNVDHAVLVSVAESLMNDKFARQKRYIEGKPENPGTTPSRKVSYAETAESIHEVIPNIDLEPEKSQHGNNETQAKTRTESYTTILDNIEASDYIEFDEVLRNLNIANDTKKYNRRKPQLNETNDYLDLGDIRVFNNNDTEQFVKTLDVIIDGTENTTAEPIVEKSNKVIIDLLASLNKEENNKLNASDLMNLRSSGEYNVYDAKLNDAITFDAINIIKRDVSTIPKINSTIEITTEVNINTTRPVTGLQNNVLIPLNKIIDDKQQELKDLMKIKDNLVRYIKEYNDTDIDLNGKSQEILNGTNTVLSIYNLDVFPEIQFNLRNINPNMLDKLLYKLKRDIYEVIRDVVGVKKLSKTYNLPEDLKTLIRAMSFYVHKEKNVTNIQNDLKMKQDVGVRRHLSNTEGNFNSTKGYLIEIFEVIGKDISQFEALSQNTRKIIKRVIKNHYVDDSSLIGLKLNDPEYNLANDLRNVGMKWQRMTENVAATVLADKVYAMKLLHFTLSADINKLNDALALIDFAHSRRMVPIEGSLGEEQLNKINQGMKTISEKFEIVKKYQTGLENHEKVDRVTKPSERKSFLNKIRNLMKGSKKEIVELVNQKVPRSMIVKTIAKKKLDELAQKRMNEYEEIMRKWQNTLNVIPRDKRSLKLSRIKNHMTNIIPKYLRGKLNPAIAAKKLKTNLQNKQNQDAMRKNTNKKGTKAVAITTRNKKAAVKI